MRSPSEHATEPLAAPRRYEAALAINGSYFQTLTNLAVLLAIRGGRDDEAIACCDRAIESNPLYEEAYNAKGVLLRDQGMITEAIACYDKCLEVSGGQHGNADHNRLLALNYLPLRPGAISAAHRDWAHGFSAKVLEACLGLDDRHPPAGRGVAASSSAEGDGAAAAGGEKKLLTVGYVSPDFLTHSVSYFIHAPLTAHDRSRVRVICCEFPNQPSPPYAPRPCRC